jgi:ribonuclease HIII
LNAPIRFPEDKRVLGIDESGKGDFIGPLVIAGVLADGVGAERLKNHEIRDSKRISDSRVLELSRWVEDNFIHSVVVIGPEKYNQLYEKIRNLNRLLAWGHSRVIENVAAKNKVDLAISDKFGRSDFIERALMQNGRKIELRQEVRAESISQVAAGSILARAAFIRYMEKMSKLYDMVMPKGAGDAVDRVALAFVKKYGLEELGKIAKVHFRNYRKIVG